VPENSALIAQRELFLQVLWQYYGSWYRWGGDDPSGFDCSGLVVEGLQSVGILPERFDATAAKLFQMFVCYSIPDPVCGALVFWKNAGGHIVHVETCLNRHYAIGARGAGSSVENKEKAIATNAFVKVRPIFGRRWSHELAGFIDLFTHPDITAPLGAGGGG